MQSRVEAEHLERVVPEWTDAMTVSLPEAITGEPATVTQQLRDEMHAIDRLIWGLEDALSYGDPEYERLKLPLARKRRRRLRLAPRCERVQEELREGQDGAFWKEQAGRVIRHALNVLLAKRALLYRMLRAEYRRNGKLLAGARA
jgi:hypothetical protein